MGSFYPNSTQLWLTIDNVVFTPNCVNQTTLSVLPATINDIFSAKLVFGVTLQIYTWDTVGTYLSQP